MQSAQTSDLKMNKFRTFAYLKIRLWGERCLTIDDLRRKSTYNADSLNIFRWRLLQAQTNGNGASLCIRDPGGPGGRKVSGRMVVRYNPRII